MRLKATIRDGFVIKASLYKNALKIWDRYCEKRYDSVIIYEKFWNGTIHKFITYEYLFFLRKTNIIEKIIKNCGDEIHERYQDNILIRRLKRQRGYNHDLNTAAYQEWYDNGIRKLEYYYLFGDIHNAIGPAVCKWNSSGYMINCKYSPSVILI